MRARSREGTILVKTTGEPTVNLTENEPASGELHEEELEKVSGGVPNIMKTKRDTVKNTISNIH